VVVLGEKLDRINRILILHGVVVLEELDNNIVLFKVVVWPLM
jgi:hypothetical protein